VQLGVLNVVFAVFSLPASPPPPKTHTALDELVLRILQHGLLDGSGARYDPSIVRIGVNVHHSVKSVSLEAQLEQKLGSTERVSVYIDTATANQGLQRGQEQAGVLES
jgi:senataxin